ncbi:hypothetical protein BC828DRAFT_404504 [Blastocladiella britannica]|nr:hypothetical protein BC828DRAFT_404504 [Blastocladiella britannica]
MDVDDLTAIIDCQRFAKADMDTEVTRRYLVLEVRGMKHTLAALGGACVPPVEIAFASAVPDASSYRGTQALLTFTTQVSRNAAISLGQIGLPAPGTGRPKISAAITGAAERRAIVQHRCLPVTNALLRGAGNDAGPHGRRDHHPGWHRVQDGQEPWRRRHPDHRGRGLVKCLYGLAAAPREKRKYSYDAYCLLLEGPPTAGENIPESFDLFVRSPILLELLIKAYPAARAAEAHVVVAELLSSRQPSATWNTVALPVSRVKFKPDGARGKSRSRIPEVAEYLLWLSEYLAPFGHDLASALMHWQSLVRSEPHVATLTRLTPRMSLSHVAMLIMDATSRAMTWYKQLALCSSTLQPALPKKPTYAKEPRAGYPTARAGVPPSPPAPPHRVRDCCQEWRLEQPGGQHGKSKGSIAALINDPTKSVRDLISHGSFASSRWRAAAPGQQADAPPAAQFNGYHRASEQSGKPFRNTTTNKPASSANAFSSETFVPCHFCVKAQRMLPGPRSACHPGLWPHCARLHGRRGGPAWSIPGPPAHSRRSGGRPVRHGLGHLTSLAHGDYHSDDARAMIRGLNGTERANHLSNAWLTAAATNTDFKASYKHGVSEASLADLFAGDASPIPVLRGQSVSRGRSRARTWSRSHFRSQIPLALAHALVISWLEQQRQRQDVAPPP